MECSPPGIYSQQPLHKKRLFCFPNVTVASDWYRIGVRVMNPLFNKYQRNIDELQRKAVFFWPERLSEEAFRQSVVPLLLETQEEFIAILKVPVADLSGLFNVLDASTFPPNLFLLHLVILTDVGGEMLQRINSSFPLLFPTGVLEYRFEDKKGEYQFKKLPVTGSLNNKRLGIDGKTVSSKTVLNDLMRDVIALLIFGSSSTSPLAARVLAKCVLNQYLGKPAELDRFIRQRYIWVSKATQGSLSNTLGHLAERSVVKYITDNLNIPGATVRSNSFLPGVTHRGERSESQKPTTFDIVVTNGTRYVAIEISFQVTTNSVIERKGREAENIFNQVEAAGHKIAYIIDGAGNFQRRSAVTNLCNNSHCTVAFTEPEFELLVQFIREHLTS